MLTLVAFSITVALQAGGVLDDRFVIAGSATGQVDVPYIGGAASGRDLDGDGLGDFVLIRTNPYRLEAHSGLDGRKLWAYPYSRSPHPYGDNLSMLADVDGDGRAEVVLGLPGFDSVVLLSGATGGALWTYTHASFGAVGADVEGMGDLNGDLVPDVIAFCPWLRIGLTIPGGCVLISGADGTVISVRLHQAAQWSTETATPRIAGIGDADRDGVEDYLLGMVLGSHSYEVRVVSGATGATLRIYPGNEMYWGCGIAAAGDLDRDGVMDHLITALQQGFIYAYSGRSGAQLWVAEAPPSLGWSRFGRTLQRCSDLDGDGIRDVMAGVPYQYDSVTSQVQGSIMLLSGANGERIGRIPGMEGLRVGMNLSSLGDVSGDGVTEFLYGGWGSLYGEVRVGSWHSGLWTDAEEISVSAGGRVRCRLGFPDSAAGVRYRVLLSRTGPGPTNWGGLLLPMTPDVWTTRSFGAPLFPGAHGILGPDGDAFCSVIAPPGFGAGTIGSTFWICAVVDAGGLPTASSVVRTLAILP